MPSAAEQQDYPVISCICLSLGIIAGASLILSIYDAGHRPFWIFSLSLPIFHFLEFFLTIIHHPLKHSYEGIPPSSLMHLIVIEFVLHESPYLAAMLGASCEYWFWRLAVGFNFYHQQIFILGIVMVLVGQLARSRAMQEAGKSFTHQIAEEREAHHHFVNTGLYAIMRHPSYFGFWMWSMGLTLVLGNPLSFLAFAIILHRFFSGRIAEEEKLLTIFFPNHYPSYRRRVWSGIPLVK